MKTTSTATPQYKVTFYRWGRKRSKRFTDLEAAKRYASKVFNSTGIYLGIEKVD